MINSRSKNSLKSIMHTRPFLYFLGLIIIFSAWNLVDFWGKMQETKEKKLIAEQKFLELKNNKEKMESDIEKLNSERGVEGVLRENFGLAKEGEGLIVIVEEENKDEQNVPRKSLWGNLIGIFK